MATKTITASVTLHVPGPKHKPFKFSPVGIATDGVYDIIEVAPGTPVKIDAVEADALIERGIAELYSEKAAIAAAADTGSDSP